MAGSGRQSQGACSLRNAGSGIRRAGFHVVVKSRTWDYTAARYRMLGQELVEDTALTDLPKFSSTLERQTGCWAFLDDLKVFD